MTAVSNKTKRPISVPLPGGKTLHLGPGNTGQVSAKAAEDPRLKKLVDAGELEVIDDEPGSRSVQEPASEVAVSCLAIPPVTVVAAAATAKGRGARRAPTAASVQRIVVMVWDDAPAPGPANHLRTHPRLLRR